MSVDELLLSNRGVEVVVPTEEVVPTEVGIGVGALVWVGVGFVIHLALEPVPLQTWPEAQEMLAQPTTPELVSLTHFLTLVLE